MQLEIVLACGVLALLYGLWTIRSVLSLPAGTARMQEIAAAIQEGARAYLNRQYRTIAMVGVVVYLMSRKEMSAVIHEAEEEQEMVGVAV